MPTTSGMLIAVKPGEECCSCPVGLFHATKGYDALTTLGCVTPPPYPSPPVGYDGGERSITLAWDTGEVVSDDTVWFKITALSATVWEVDYYSTAEVFLGTFNFSGSEASRYCDTSPPPGGTGQYDEKWKMFGPATGRYREYQFEPPEPPPAWTPFTLLGGQSIEFVPATQQRVDFELTVP